MAVALIAVCLAVGLPVVGLFVMMRGLQPGTLGAHILSLAEATTGRTVSARAMTVRMLPEPIIDAEDIVLANPAGFSRPAMMTARRARLVVALIPLLSHRLVIRQIALQGVDLKLEQQAGQAPNWRFTPAAQPDDAGPHPAERRDFRSVTLLGLAADGVLTWQRPGSAGAVRLPALRLVEANARSSIGLSATLDLPGGPAALSARLGAQAQLWDVQDRSAWPVEARLTAPVGTITVAGILRQPRSLAGYDLTVAARGADLGVLFTGWPGVSIAGLPIPRLRTIALDARIVDRATGGTTRGDTTIAVPRLALTAAPSDLSAIMPGLRLERLAIAAPNLDGSAGNQSNSIALDGDYAGRSLSLHAVLGPVFGPDGQRAGRSLPIDATLQIAGAAAKLQGRLQPRGDLSGSDLTLHAGIAELAALSPIAGHSLPPLNDIYIDGRVRSERGVLTVDDVHLSGPEMEMRASGTLRLGSHAAWRGSLHVVRLDLDSLLPVLLAGHTAVSDREDVVAAHPGLRLSVLRGIAASVDLEADAESVRVRGIDLAIRAAPASLHAGRIVIGPVIATIGGNAMTAQLSVDTTPSGPVVTAAVDAPALDGASLAGLLGMAGTFTGHLAVAADLTGHGADPASLIASLGGAATLALTNGVLANRPLLAALGAILPAAQLGLTLPSTGHAAIACLTAGLDLHDGVARVRTAFLSTPRFRLAATGTIDLPHATIDMQLRPVLQLGRSSLVLPARAIGAWRALQLTLQPAGAGPPSPALTLADHGTCDSAIAATHVSRP